jgi:hypothetical protein
MENKIIVPTTTTPSCLENIIPNIVVMFYYYFSKGETIFTLFTVRLKDGTSIKCVRSVDGDACCHMLNNENNDILKISNSYYELISDLYGDWKAKYKEITIEKTDSNQSFSIKPSLT